MEHDTIHELLADAAAERAKDGEHYLFARSDQVTILIAAHGVVEAVEGVESLRLNARYLELTARDQTVYADPGALLAIKIRRGQREGAGFCP